VANLAKVSPGTVSRVLNNNLGQTRIGALTRERIEEAAKTLNYAPNVNAQRLFGKKSLAIGLVMPSYSKLGTHVFENAHIVRMISGLESELPKKDCELVLFFNDEDFSKTKKHLSLFRSRSVDVMLVWGAYDGELFWKDLAKAGLPHVFLGNTPACSPSANFVGADYRKAGYLAARLLLELGHRDIAWLGGKQGISLTREQEAGIRMALGEAGLPLPSSLCDYGDFKKESGREGFLRMKRGAASAVLAANVNMGEGAAEAIEAQGLKLGRDISVIACDSVKDAGETQRLARIACDDVLTGRLAMESALELAANPKLAIRKLIDVGLVEGETCGEFCGRSPAL
jgi:DNA-binding LacI/PurR family transcriptional regulator